MNTRKVLQLGFLPRSADAALFVLRLWLGLFAPALARLEQAR